MPQMLTDQERQVLDYLVEYLRSNTYQPSIREIGRTFGIKSTKTVSELLQSLAVKGWVERDPSRSRGVRLLGVDLQTHAISIPMHTAHTTDELGSVHGLDLDRRIASSGNYLIVMPDEALKASGIQKGDMLLVEPVDPGVLDAGDIVLAIAGGMPTVRRYNDSPSPRLESDDSTGGSVMVATNGDMIQGRVISVVRRLRSPAISAPIAAV
ncbi:MAG: S24 family peptidase [Longimicrobiales bacterium]